MDTIIIIILCIMSVGAGYFIAKEAIKEIKKQGYLTIGDLFIYTLFSFIPIVNIIVFVALFKDEIDVSRFFNKKIWKKK